jgi:hypothetical protein
LNINEFAQFVLAVNCGLEWTNFLFYKKIPIATLFFYLRENFIKRFGLQALWYLEKKTNGCYFVFLKRH